MEDLKKLTPTELLKLANDTSKLHQELKEEIIQKTYEVDEMVKKLTELEKRYVEIIEEVNNRD